MHDMQRRIGAARQLDGRPHDKRRFSGEGFATAFCSCAFCAGKRLRLLASGPFFAGRIHFRELQDAASQSCLEGLDYLMRRAAD